MSGEMSPGRRTQENAREGNFQEPRKNQANGRKKQNPESDFGARKEEHDRPGLEKKRGLSTAKERRVESELRGWKKSGRGA